MNTVLKPAAKRGALKPAAKRGLKPAPARARKDQGVEGQEPCQPAKKIVNLKDENIQLQSPYHRCSLYGVALVAAEIFDPDFCIHGPQGCISTIKEGFAIQGKEVEYHTSGMSKDDIVFGGEDTLFESVADIYSPYEKAGPKFVITSCSSEIIGDNVNSVLAKFHPDLPTVKVAGGGVNGNQYRGINNTLFELMSRFPNKSSPKVKNRVNLIGNVGLSREWRGDYYELVRLLGQIGVEVNRIACDSTLDNYKLASTAELTILTNPEIGVEAAKFLNESCNVPFFSSSQMLPLGLRGTEAWLREIGDVLNIDKSILDEFILDEEIRVRGRLKIGLNQVTYIEKLINAKGTSTAIIAEGPVAYSWARFISEEMEMKPTFIGLRTGADDSELNRLFDELNRNLGYDIDIAEVSTFSDVTSKMKEHKIEYLIGSSVEADISEELGMKGFLHISHPNTRYITVVDRPFWGYNGVINAAESILNAISPNLMCKES